MPVRNRLRLEQLMTNIDDFNRYGHLNGVLGQARRDAIEYLEAWGLWPPRKDKRK